VPVFNEPIYLPDVLKWEQERNYSREEVVILAGSGAARTLTTGMVVGRATKGAATGAAVGGNTGNGTITAAPTVGAATKVGVYRLVCIEPAANLGTFLVSDPDGVALGAATVGTQAVLGGLTFTIADGATDFVSGDSFTITVAAGTGKVVQLTLAATNGTEDAYGVLVADATAADGADGRGVVLVRNAIIDSSKLIWPAGADTDQKAAALALLATQGIIARTGV
jgi:hypothetical protein